MTQTTQMDESKGDSEPGPDPDSNVEEARPLRDPGVSEDVWQELEISKALEQVERDRLRELEEEAIRFLKNINFGIKLTWLKEVDRLNYLLSAWCVHILPV